MTCLLCNQPVLWAHQCGWPAPFEEITEGRILILNGIATDLKSMKPEEAAMWNGPRYEYHRCKEKENA